MLGKWLLPMFAAAALAGCATDYNYRNGNGDYYYGQPRVEYRSIGPGGYYGSFGLGYGSYGNSSSYYYDRFGRLVFGYPGTYYGSPYYYGGYGGYRPRPPRGHGEHNDHDGDNGTHADRPPPWRDLGRLQPRDQNENSYRDRDENFESRQRPTRHPQQDSYPEARSRQQNPTQTAPVFRERSESPSRMGGSRSGAERTQGRRNTPPEE